MNEQNITPEVIYKKYRQTRTEPDFVAAKNAAVPESIAEEVYRQFQNTRISEREASIDAIMSGINQNGSSADRYAEVEETKRVNRKLISLFGLPDRILSRFFDQLAAAPALLKFAVPTIAAGVLAVVLIPGVFEQSESRSTAQYAVPPALTQSANALVDYIDNADSVSLGLSAPNSSVNTAFNRGTLSVDLSLAFLADQTDVVNGVINKFSSAGNNEQTALAAAARQLHDSVNSANDPSTKQGLYTALQAQLSDFSSDTNSQRWFAHGQAVESILIASQFALNSNDTQILQQALTAAKALSTTDLNHPSLKLINELRGIPQGQTQAPAQIRELIAKAKNIKLLMQ